MSTPIKSTSLLLRSRGHLSPRSSRFSAAKSSASPNTPKNKLFVNNRLVSTFDHCLLLDTPHKNRVLNVGLDKENLLHLLGKGSFGSVVKGQYKNQMVAAKVIKLEKANQEIKEQNARFLTHKNIIKILDIVISEKYALILMEYFENSRNLQQVLDESNEALPLQKVVQYVRDVAEGLQFCHENSILHLDIKPKNVLLCNFEVCKICDFGNCLNEYASQYTFHGTVGYAAPEILKGLKPTSKSDVYSLGILMWQLLTRKNPYAFLENEVVIYRVVKFGLRPDLPENCDLLADLCRKCWAEEPQSRPSAAQLCGFLNELCY